MEMPSISLCMIVKNEEEYLPKCLGSVKRVVDEIIIVDTGSTDSTLAIAKSFGAKVIQMPWEDSFSAARNRSFDEATGDWILWLDADEEMDVNEVGKLKELLSRGTVHEQRIEGIQFMFYNHLERGVESVQLLRMVRNRPEYRFEERIHEQILPNMLKYRPDLQLGQVDIHVHHYGYLTQNAVDQDKTRRNIELLQQSMAEHPEYPHYLFYWSAELYRKDDLEGALRNVNVFLNSVEEDVGKEWLASAHKYRLMTLTKMKRYDDLVQYSEESIARFPGFMDLYHLGAVGFHELGETDKAIELLRKALSLGPAEEGYSSIVGSGTFLTCMDLGMLCNYDGNTGDADLYYTVASLMVGDPGIRFHESRGFTD